MLGSGGFAAVHAALGPDDHPVAVKVLHRRFAGHVEVEAAFRAESATAAALAHPHVVRVLATGVDRDHSYFVMELCPESLASRLARQPQLPESECLRVLRGVAAALAFAHRRGILHKDLKTANVLFADDATPVLADFGMANVADRYVTATGVPMTVGTPHYLAPEQVQGHPLDGRTDLYALGVTAYRAATGRLPFTGSEWFELARRHIEDPPPPLRTLRPELTRAFERLVLTCLAKHPNDRYATADELIGEIDKVEESEG